MARSFHPYPIVGATKSVLIGMLITAVLFIVRNLLGDYFLHAAIIVWFICLLFVTLSFAAVRFHTLTLDETSLSYHSGILSTRNIVLPYSRITEASYTQGLVQRVFGVGSMNLDTAGGAEMAVHVHDIKYSDIKDVMGEVKMKGGKGPSGM
ncbi:MAG: PH domain-containing protein [Candidatus Micrarchaeota archaeon]